MDRALRGLGIASVAAVAVALALVVGQAVVADRATGASRNATATTVPLPSAITRDEAIALVRGRTDQLGRIDRIDARLVTYEEYLRVAGPIHVPAGDPRATPDLNGVSGWAGDPATRYLWAVAVSGEVWPQYRVPTFFGRSPPVSPTPFPPYRWGIFLVDALQGRLAMIGGAGIAEDWPPVFARLPDHPAMAYAPASATPGVAPISVPKLGPEAMTEVLRTFYAGGTPRIDRIQYKLMSALEFRASGLSLPIGVADASPVWVVAVGGDIPSLKKSASDPSGYRSVLDVVDANTSRSDSVIASWTDPAATWPAVFDRLPDHPAVSVPYPAPTAAVGTRLGTRLGTIALGMSAAGVRAALGDPSETTVSHGLGSPEWHYASGVWVFLRGSTTDPGTVWQIRIASPFDRATAEGLRVGSTESAARALYTTATDPDADQIQITDGARTTLDIHFDVTRHVDWIILNTQP